MEMSLVQLSNTLEVNGRFESYWETGFVLREVHLPGEAEIITSSMNGCWLCVVFLGV